jgi:membrane protein DedA with SNARE-associated domain
VLEDLIQNLGESLGQWAYVLVGAMAMAETAAFVGFIAPGEFAVIFGGVLAGEGTLSVVVMVGIVWASCVAGDSIGFVLGRRLGRGWAVKHGPKVRLTEERLGKVEDFFHRHGGKTIVIGRWVGLVRPLMPFTAGTSGMSYRAFLPYDVIGAGLWGATFTLLGYFFWQSFTKITSIASRGALVLGITIGVLVAGYHLFKHLRDPAERRRLAAWLDRQGRRPALRPVAAMARPLGRHVFIPLGRLIGPPLRFTLGRLTPGGLGLEFTTVLAILAVSLYVVILQIGMVNDGSTITGDRWSLDLARDVYGGALTTLAKTVSFFGRFWVVTIAVFAAAALLAVRRRVLEAAGLVAGLVVTEVAVQVIKNAVERPRPSGGLVDSDGFGYPSGHAALAASYVAIAVLLSRLVSLPRRLALVLAGFILAAAIGVSRVYLRVHYLSDVVGGWSVGAGAYSACAVIALLAAYLTPAIRGRSPSPPPPDVASRRASG